MYVGILSVYYNVEGVLQYCVFTDDDDDDDDSSSNHSSDDNDDII